MLCNTAVHGSRTTVHNPHALTLKFDMSMHLLASQDRVPSRRELRTEPYNAQAAQQEPGSVTVALVYDELSQLFTLRSTSVPYNKACDISVE